jgi:dephospho-CoA kinase
MHRIGLTGGICSGKSYVLGIFEALGCCTLRADRLAREIMFAKDSPVQKEIAALFGPTVSDGPDGLNREALARRLFEEADKRLAVNALVHPLVAEERRRRFNEAEKLGIYDFIIYESALLAEAGLCEEFEKIVVVYTSLEEQRRRLMARDAISSAEAEARLQAQFPLREKLRIAAYAIDTSGSMESTRTKTLEVYHLLRRDFNMTEFVVESIHGDPG